MTLSYMSCKTTINNSFCLSVSLSELLGKLFKSVRYSAGNTRRTSSSSSTTHYRTGSRTSILHVCVTSVLLIGAELFLASCNDDGVIEAGRKPVIHLDNNGVYIGYAGHGLTIAPRVENADNATYEWTIDGQVISTSPELCITRDEPTTLYAVFAVTTDNGTTREEIRIEIVTPPSPSIDLGITGDVVKVLCGTTHVFAPRFTDVDDPDKAVWALNGQQVHTGSEYTYKASELGHYTLTVSASNTFGTTEATVEIEVVDQLPYSASFAPRSVFDASTDRVGVVGRYVYLAPEIENINDPTYAWTIDGRTAGDGMPFLRFMPQATGRYVVTVTVTGTAVSAPGATPETVEATATVIVEVYASAGRIRNGSTAEATTVFEYVPGPGQFINETNALSGFDGTETTLEAANAYALRRLNEGKFVSLGAFGGYLVVGFDHSIKAATDGYDFAIAGNAFDTSSEPGIVWVMQDTNGNGLPDDQWYELSGSETGKTGTWVDYAVTYRRGAPGANIEWTDNHGQSGYVASMSTIHVQPSIYPAWVTADAYTLRGTRLEARNGKDPDTKQWINAAYDRGYVDNMGSDQIGEAGSAGEARSNGFRIANAILPDGTHVDLDFIDFVKIQTGVIANSGPLGEISTEVLGVYDLKK